MKNKLRLMIAVIYIFSVNLLTAQSKEKVLSAGFNTSLHSEYLNENRTLSVYLPKDYDQNNDDYAVLYILDGDFFSLFLEGISATNYLHDMQDYPEFIIVGIHTKKNRDRDLVPSKMNTQNKNVNNFLKFLTEELKPYIEKEYRTTNYNILFGASNGGLFALYTLLNKPYCFDAIISISPSIGHCPDLLKEQVKLFVKNASQKKKPIYFNYGKTDNPYTLDFLPQFFTFFKEILPVNYPVKLELIESQGHVPFGSIFEGLKYTFSQRGAGYK